MNKLAEKMQVWWIWLERFLEYLAAINHTEQTIATRKKLLTIFINWCQERDLLEPSSITLEHLERYRSWLTNYRSSWVHSRKNNDYLDAATIAQRLSNVRVFFTYLAKRGVIKENPASVLESPKVEKRLPKAILNSSEAEIVLGQPNLETAVGIRDRSILELLYSTAIRKAELANLRVQDLDKQRGFLTVRCGKGQKDRCVPIGERAIAYLELYLEKVRICWAKGEDNQRMFLTTKGTPLSKHSIADAVSAYIKKADIGKRGRCHIWRHTCATLMLENGADIRYIQEMLGHSNLATTQIYTKVSDMKLKEVHSRTHPSSSLRTHFPANNNKTSQSLEEPSLDCDKEEEN
jgi:integrase/recombinase XerD